MWKSSSVPTVAAFWTFIIATETTTVETGQMSPTAVRTPRPSASSLTPDTFPLVLSSLHKHPASRCIRARTSRSVRCPKGRVRPLFKNLVRKDRCSVPAFFRHSAFYCSVLETTSKRGIFTQRDLLRVCAHARVSACVCSK